MQNRNWQQLLASGGLACLLAVPAGAQELHLDLTLRRNLVVPQVRAIPFGMTDAVTITGVAARININGRAAETTLDLDLRNPTSRRLEAELLLPVPVDAVIKGFSFQGGAPEPTARLLARDEARRLYDGIVAKTRDPALLEFVGLSVIRSSVFPVEANGTQKVRVSYEQLLPAIGQRVDYVLPRSEALDYRVPWDLQVRIRNPQPISTVFSPSHTLDIRHPSPTEALAKFSGFASTEPGAFRLSYLVQGAGLASSLFAYPDPSKGGGYFLLLAGAPPDPAAAKAAPAVRREVTFVLDHSGSMRGSKLEQAREAALQTIAGLRDGEFFNIIAFSTGIDRFAIAPVVRSRESLAEAEKYLRQLSASGGTATYDALLEALRQPPTAGTLATVLFVTDGLPTIGNTSEVAIRQLITAHNPHRRRVFTFGVGTDVNAPLLARLAEESRGSSTFILPQEDVEVKVALMARRLAGPVILDPTLIARDAAGAPVTNRTLEIHPATLQDIYAGDQVLIVGRYLGDAPLTLVLRGQQHGTVREFNLTLEPKNASTQHGFVARQWASQKINVLVAAVRDLGADASRPADLTALRQHPRYREFVDEIVRLSAAFGVLTEFTAFLALEGTNLGALPELQARARQNLEQRAVSERSGLGALNQQFNAGGGGWTNAQFAAPSAKGGATNSRNAFYDQTLQRVELAGVRQSNGRAYYRRGDTWVDAQLAQQAEIGVTRRIAIGSPAHRQLTDRLAQDNRQGELALDRAIIALDGEVLKVE